MKKKNGRYVILFLALSFLPSLPILMSLYEFRNAVLFQKAIQVEEQKKMTIDLPALMGESLEFRLESPQLKSEVIVKAAWKLRAQGLVVIESPAQGDEWNIVRPFYTGKNPMPVAPDQLELEFLNSQLENQEVYLKISKNFEQILDRQAKLFVILLAFSLGLILVIWKPLFAVAP